MNAPKFNLDSFASAHVVILAGSDADGAIAAGMLRNYWTGLGYHVDIQFVLSQFAPCELPEDGAIVLVDLPLNQRVSTETQVQWLTDNQGRIAKVIDHHKGDEIYLSVIGEEKVLSGTAPSCPQLLADTYPCFAHSTLEKVVSLANSMDSPQQHPIDQSDTTTLSIRYGLDWAVVKFLEDKDSAALLALLTSLSRFDVTSDAIAHAAERYDVKIKTALESALSNGETYETPHGKLLVLRGVYPTSDAFARGYQQASFVAVFTTDSKMTVARAGDQTLNLLELFDLKTGAPFRIPFLGTDSENFQKLKDAFGF